MSGLTEYQQVLLLQHYNARWPLSVLARIYELPVADMRRRLRQARSAAPPGYVAVIKAAPGYDGPTWSMLP